MGKLLEIEIESIYLYPGEKFFFYIFSCSKTLQKAEVQGYKLTNLLKKISRQPNI